MSKQDRQGARTATDLEYKYKFGKSFAEVMGIAEDAQTAAEEAKDAVKDLDGELDQTEIFNRLTNNGQAQGIYRDGDDIYINAEYIRALEKMFAKDITMTGKFESTGSAYLPPTFDDAANILNAVLFPDAYMPDDPSLYDLNGDGNVTEDDAILAVEVANGITPMSQCKGAVLRPCTICIDMSNETKAIRVHGTNQFGTEVETVVGIDPASCSFATKAQVNRMLQTDEATGCLYRLNNGETEWHNPPMQVGVEYRTTERYNGKPVYTQLVSFGQMPSSGYAQKAVDGIEISKVISLEGRCFNEEEVNEFPVYMSGALGAYCWFYNKGIGVYCAKNMSAYNAEFVLKYYK
jgi:hypothetical protein